MKWDTDRKKWESPVAILLRKLPIWFRLPKEQTNY